MADVIPSRTSSGAVELDLAARKSWQYYMEAALRMATLLDARLTDRHRLSVADVRLLEVLDHSSAGHRQMGEVAAALALAPSQVTRQVRRLEDQGLVFRRACPSDRRRVVATITDVGRELLEQAMITYVDEVRAHFLRPLSRAQIAAVAAACGQKCDALKPSE